MSSYITPLERERQKKRAVRQGLAMAALVIGLGYFFYSHSERETTITVRDKKATTVGSGGMSIGTGARGGSVPERIWLIYADEGVFEVSASVAFMRLDIVTPARELEVGGTYRVSIAGWSVPFLGMRPNIIEVLEGPGVSPR